MKYYYETKSSKGWKDFDTDQKAKKYFGSPGWRSVKVWRIDKDNTRTLILKK